jgi:pimeloyl-ACP methyl ester carboxylesterase
MRRLAALAAPVLVAVVALAGPLTGCGAPTGSPVDLPDGSAALRWGDGPYGLVLVHEAGSDAASWGSQATAFADKGMTVLAVESATPDSVVAALRTLLDDAGLERVALLGAGDGSNVAMEAALNEPDLVDQLVVISAGGDAARLGVFPKLFVAAEEEPAAVDAERMADEAQGDWNALYLAPGSASGQALLSDGVGGEPTMEAIIARLEERR